MEGVSLTVDSGKTSSEGKDRETEMMIATAITTLATVIFFNKLFHTRLVIT